jgi:hypothetical protein
MNPPPRPRKRKAATLREDDWEPFKNRILELHIEEGMPLPKVKRKIEEQYGFIAEYVSPTEIRPSESSLTVIRLLGCGNTATASKSGERTRT